jgi:MoaA/NifB/PqqE/SkfB family radical SAM enzyme
MQAPPNAIQIELTEGCTLACHFCGINGIREKPFDRFKFMSLETAEKVCRNIKGWNPRIEFAMHGEPTANPEWLEILLLFREFFPHNSMMLTTNGFGLCNEPVISVKAAFADVNIIALDCYEHSRGLWEKIVDANPQGDWYPDDPDANPHRRRDQWDADLVFIRDISKQTKGTHSHLSNHAGAAAPRDFSSAGRCAKPFREMSVRWDGMVAVCCEDWRGEYPIGNLTEHDCETIWQHPRFHAARKKLYRGARDFGPCAGCTSRSTRVGLLPDKKGKETMENLNDRDALAILEAIAEGPLTEPVLRDWEQ